MKHERPFAVLLAAAFGGLVTEGAAEPLRRGELLVTDWINDRVIRLDPSSGATSVFSPPPAGTNLMATPLGIVFDEERGAALVANRGNGHLVAIDPLSGEQSVAAPTGYNGGIFGLAIAASDHGGPPGREVYLAAVSDIVPEILPSAILVFDGPLDDLQQDAIAESETFSWRSIDVDDAPTGPRAIYGSVADCDVAPDTPCAEGFGAYDFGAGTQALSLADLAITGIDVAQTRAGVGVPFLTACDETHDGLYGLLFGLFVVSEGGDIDCPDSLVASLVPRLRIFVGIGCGGLDCSTARVVEVRQVGSSYEQVATFPLPDGTWIGGMTRVPEADGALAALLALGLCARRRRRDRSLSAR